jgi:hypothetical protein
MFNLIVADCLRLLTILQTDKNSSSILSTIDGHLARLVVLSNRTANMSTYISNSILMMIPQVFGMRHYVNESWQECLNELHTAVQVETILATDDNGPTLIYARSSEVLAMHLLLIHEQLQETPVVELTVKSIHLTFYSSCGVTRQASC